MTEVQNNSEFYNDQARVQEKETDFAKEMKDRNTDQILSKLKKVGAINEVVIVMQLVWKDLWKKAPEAFRKIGLPIKFNQDRRTVKKELWKELMGSAYKGRYKQNMRLVSLIHRAIKKIWKLYKTWNISSWKLPSRKLAPKQEKSIKDLPKNKQILVEKFLSKVPPKHLKNLKDVSSLDFKASVRVLLNQLTETKKGNKEIKENIELNDLQNEFNSMVEKLGIDEQAKVYKFKKEAKNAYLKLVEKQTLGKNLEELGKKTYKDLKKVANKNNLDLKKEEDIQKAAEILAFHQTVHKIENAKDTDELYSVQQELKKNHPENYSKFTKKIDDYRETLELTSLDTYKEFKVTTTVSYKEENTQAWSMQDWINKLQDDPDLLPYYQDISSLQYLSGNEVFNTKPKRGKQQVNNELNEKTQDNKKQETQDVPVEETKKLTAETIGRESIKFVGKGIQKILKSININNSDSVEKLNMLKNFKLDENQGSDVVWEGGRNYMKFKGKTGNTNTEIKVDTLSWEIYIKGPSNSKWTALSTWSTTEFELVPFCIAPGLTMFQQNLDIIDCEDLIEDSSSIKEYKVNLSEKVQEVGKMYSPIQDHVGPILEKRITGNAAMEDLLETIFGKELSEQKNFNKDTKEDDVASMIFKYKVGISKTDPNTLVQFSQNLIKVKDKISLFQTKTIPEDWSSTTPNQLMHQLFYQQERTDIFVGPNTMKTWTSMTKLLGIFCGTSLDEPRLDLPSFNKFANMLSKEESHQNMKEIFNWSSTASRWINNYKELLKQKEQNELELNMDAWDNS